jgi:hypothetical protein
MKGSETVTDRFATGQKAATVLKNLLPASWLFRKQIPDFHIDYVVEVVEAGEPTGMNFGVQLKGAQPKKGKPICLKYSLKTKHLRYYLHKATVPVFLVLVDVFSSRGYWCFTQKYAHEAVPSNRLQKKGTISVSFSEKDCLAELDRFKEAVRAAIDYVRDLHPGSVPAAVQAEKAKLQRIDPRINISIAMQDGQQHVTLTANEQFEFRAKITDRDTPEFRQALVDFLEKGVELKVKSSALQFEGAPLLSHVFGSTEGGHVALKFVRKVHGAMQVFVGGGDSGFLFQTEGLFRCGTKYATFEGALPNSALSVATTVCAEGLLKREPHYLQLSFNPDNWSGQPLTGLAYFDVIHQFIRNLKERKATRLKFLCMGSELFGTEFSGLDTESVEDIFEVVELLRKARFIARKYHLNPALPPIASISGAELKAIQDLYDLVNSGEARMPHPNFRLTFTVTGDPIGSLDSRPGTLRINGPRREFQFFDGKIQLGPITHFFTCASVAGAAPIAGGETEIVMTGSEKSQWIMKFEDLSRGPGNLTGAPNQPQE